jgi:hypothetical protein
MHGFAILSDFFATLLIDEQKQVLEHWRSNLHGVIAGIEKVREVTGPSDTEESS